MIYIMLLDRNDFTSGCAVDLDKLPSGANSNTVAHPWHQGPELIGWLKADIERTKQLILNIAQNCMDVQTIDFITSLASFWENIPPALEKKDGAVAIIAGNDAGDFLRTSPDVAKEMWTKFCALRPAT